MPPKAVTSQHKGRVKGKHKTASQKGSKTMAKKLTVYEDYMLQLMTMFQNHIDGVKIRNDVFGDDIEWERLNKMQAWYTTINDVEFLKSYDTIVAVYDGKDLYVRGKTTATTARQITTYARNKHIINLEQPVPFFKYEYGVRM